MVRDYFFLLNGTLHRLLYQMLINSCTRHWFGKNNVPICVTDVGSLQKQLSFTDCCHHSCRTDEVVQCLHLPCVGAPGFVIHSAPTICAAFLARKTPNGTNESWKPCLKWSLDVVLGSSLCFCCVSNGTLLLTEGTDGGCVRVLWGWGTPRSVCLTGGWIIVGAEKSSSFMVRFFSFYNPSLS